MIKVQSSIIGIIMEFTNKQIFLEEKDEYTYIFMVGQIQDIQGYIDMLFSLTSLQVAFR